MKSRAAEEKKDIIKIADKCLERIKNNLKKASGRVKGRFWALYAAFDRGSHIIKGIGMTQARNQGRG